MRRWALFGYGLAGYIASFVALRYFIGFIDGILVPRSLDEGPSAPLGEALARDVGWFVLFGLQHSLMARPRAKRWIERHLPQPMERTTYVLVSTVLLVALLWMWRPIPQPLWRVEGHLARGAVWALSVSGWLLIAVASLSMDHFHLFGLKQAWRALRRRPQPELPFRTPGPYRLVRHPIYLGFLIGCWAAPTLTVGHALFASLMTLYVWIGIRFEERDLLRRFGAPYADYRASVGRLLPRLLPARSVP